MSEKLKNIVSCEGVNITVLDKVKECIHSVRYDSPEGQKDGVTSNIYIQNKLYDALDCPDSIVVTVKRAD